jgi:hypothetical protein
MRVTAALAAGLYESPHDEKENRGPSERHLSAETAVWRREPHTHLGGLDRVLMDDETNMAAALVLRRGVVFKHDVVLPIRYVVEVFDDLVHVDIAETDWDSLVRYESERSS